ncbi:MAG: hypothetical protein JWO11_4139 [Nocardioides sp.]|nr:hypothetical protein [Nocardioides sp.]
MITGFLLLIVGLCMIAAEIWLATIGTPLALVACLLVLTGLTEYIVAREWWDEVRP